MERSEYVSPTLVVSTFVFDWTGITDLGILVKDVDKGHIDFLGQRDGQDIFLWQPIVGTIVYIGELSGLKPFIVGINESLR
jgi:hypothetical protein